MANQYGKWYDTGTIMCSKLSGKGTSGLTKLLSRNGWIYAPYIAIHFQNLSRTLFCVCVCVCVCIVDMHSTSSTISHTALAGNANSVALNSFIT